MSYVGMGLLDIAGSTQEELINHETRRLLNAQARWFEANGGIVAEAHLRIGKADEEIVPQAEKLGAGLFIHGAPRAQRYKTRSYQKHISHSVIRHAYCPVLVVREER
ncbi:MAG: universal stress protein [Rubrobacter sp.]|nr:universal stress protein [Rubrobacter sp.]